MAESAAVPWQAVWWCAVRAVRSHFPRLDQATIEDCGSIGVLDALAHATPGYEENHAVTRAMRAACDLIRARARHQRLHLAHRPPPGRGVPRLTAAEQGVLTQQLLQYLKPTHRARLLHYVWTGEGLHKASLSKLRHRLRNILAGDQTARRFRDWAQCHPDRSHYCRGLCMACYNAARTRLRARQN